jgi:hypothetical protein
MDAPKMNDEKFREMRIVQLIQEVRIIAVCDENYIESDPADKDSAVEGSRTTELIIDSSRRPIPVPYTEAE